MNSNKFKIALQVMGLGLLSGMRSIAGPAIASHVLSRHPSKQLFHSPLKLLQSKNVSIALKVLAAGEFIGDKLPVTPDRIKPLSVIFRCISGSIVGAGIYKASSNSALNGAIIGGLTACGSTFGSFYLRKIVVKKSNISDPIIGTIEDALVLGAGIRLINVIS